MGRWKDRKIRLSAGPDYDALFEQLEQAVTQYRSILVENVMSDAGALQAVSSFLYKYRYIISKTKFFERGNQKTDCFIKIRENVKGQKNYLGIRSLYSKNYYLHDCGGYEVFNESRGRQMDWRLHAIFALVAPQAEDHTLDVGCGRGELSYRLHLSGASVCGVDYSQQAIRIANDHYDGIKRENLQFVCKDIMELNRADFQWNKIVMADVVEHIEQPILEKLFRKIADILTEDGVLVIHTAPNKDYYSHIYPQKREKAKELGIFLPKNPRSYYEDEMHINEQSPRSLRETLKQCFSNVLVWTGGADNIEENRTPEEEQREISIFALAANSEAALRAHIDLYCQKPDLDKMAISLDFAGNQTGGADRAAFDIGICNKGTQELSSWKRYPVFVSYHVLDANGQVLLFDGQRFHLNQVLYPQMRDVIRVWIDRKYLKEQAVTVRVTMVAEHCFWFDEAVAGSFLDLQWSGTEFMERNSLGG